MPSQKWQERVKKAQEMAAQRLGVDVSTMKPPRQPAGEGAVAEATAAPAAEAQPVAAGAASAQKAAGSPEVPKPVAPASVALSPAARRIAEAKARAAAKTNGSGNGAVAAAAVPEVRKTAPVLRGGAEPVGEEAEEVGREGINRREFMTYAWGLALGLLTVEAGAATYQFMYPRFRAGEFGGKFILGAAASLPSPEAAPDGNTTGKFWMVDTEEGPKALYMVCTHLGCLYKWEPSNFRFECPCHGSKFTHDGHFIEGPAPRSLDQFVIEIEQNGQIVAQTSDTGDAIVPPAIPSPEATIVVDTGNRILGKPAAESPARADV